ncbi:hypothetical protein KJ909_03440, partial [Patescibacteria group bacterium]|nr:hypothetical protein [Patescibacteria group bacterium]
MLRKLRFLFSYVVFFILSFFVFGVNDIKAFDIFSDEFNYQDDSKWNYILNGGSVSFIDGVVTLESNGFGFPVVYSKLTEVFPPNADTVFEVKFKYNSSGPMGDGISIGYTGFSSYPFYQFSLWNDTYDDSTFMYNDFSLSKYGQCNHFVEYGDLVDRQYRPIEIPISVWHILQIKKTGFIYEVILDDNSLFVTKDNQCLPTSIILGNPLQGGSKSWSSLSIDYLKVSTTGGDIISHKLIIVPGLGASWNSRAMVYNENVDPKEWKMTPFVKNYDGLILALEDKGLVEDKDFFIWNYDWRRPLDEITENLDDFVDEVASGEEVDMLGHSLGALVARVWAQKNESKAGKIIGLGGPQKGSLNAYDAWNGAKVSDKFDIRSIALNILLQLQKKNKETRVETIRAYSPILKDLLPVFDFAKMGTRVLSFANLESKNDYLVEKNNTVASLFGKLEEMVSVGEKTKEWVILKPRSIFEETLGLWSDGVPTKYLDGVGDGTVLKKSAKFEGDDFVEITGKHGEMVGDLLDEIFAKLDLGTVGISAVEVPDLSSSTVFFVGSPVEMSLNCEGDEYLGNDGFILIDGDKYEKCEVNLTAVGHGTYHLVSGRVDKEDWRYFEGEVKEGEVLTFEVKANDGSLLLDGEVSENYLYSLIKRDIGLLKEEFGEDDNLVEAEQAVESKNLELLMDAIFGFRKEKREMAISERILGNLK